MEPMRTQMTTLKRLIVLLALAALAAAIASLAIPTTANAGTYTVWECAGTAGGPAAGPDIGNNNGGYSTGNAGLSAGPTGYAPGDCQSYGSFGLGNAGSFDAPGTYRAFDVMAPPGTVFTGGYAEANIYNGNGWQGLLSIGDGSALQNHVTTDTAGNWQGYNWSGAGGTRQLVLWMTCGGGAGCGGGGQFAYGRNLTFQVNDYTSPSVSLGGSLTGGGWFNGGSGTLNVSGSDYGGGVFFIDTYVNGTHLNRGGSACPEVTLFSVPVGTRLTPCPTSNSTSISQSAGSGPIHQGANTFMGCVYDYARDGNPNGNCASTTINVDTAAPESVSDLSVAGGEAWRPDNEFDLSWSNPSQAYAPIDGAAYRITKLGGGYDSGRQFVPGSNRQTLNDLTLPSAGEYQLKVWVRDAALNESEASARTATLRLDPTVPPEVQAQNNGWIRRNDFDYTARWNQIPPSQVGPSGLDGYAVRVTQDPTTDPCVTDAHPAASCSPAEVNNDGIGDTEMPVPAGEVSEGQWYIHVVPVTGAGLKAAAVQHTPMPVDMTDPRTSISGTGGDWGNHDVTVGVTASDALSGMSPRASHPMDPQPRTCIQVDGAGPDCEPDGDLTRVISGEGEHTVRYFARDLAGNENNGQADAEALGRLNRPPDVASVRIDKSGPRLAFASSRRADDPSLIEVSAGDALSGLAGGIIEFREQGSNASWVALDTVVTQDSLRGYVPDGVDPGRYEFRASARDNAGNASSTSTRGDGSAMVESLPLKEPVNLTATVERPGEEPPKDRCENADGGKGECGKAAIRVGVPYGEPIRISGHLQTSADVPLRGRELTVTERMADGGTPSVRTQSLETDHGGAYGINLEAGPSRTVTVRFAGEARYRPTAADPVDLAVRSRVLAFKASRRVPERKSIRFQGRVGVDGVELGAQGKRIELQYEKSKGHWRTIDSGQTAPDGTFTIRYPLRSNYIRPTKVRFRVLVPAERAWPYFGAAASRPRRTVILP